MSALFTQLERSIVKNMLLRKSHKDIAVFMNRPVEDIDQLAGEITTARPMITFQMKLDAKNLAKPPRPAKVKVKKASVKLDEKRAREKEQERKAVMQHRRNMEMEQKARRAASREPRYDTKQVDYSKLVTVRIDRQTIIYAKPGEEAAAKAAFLKTYVKPIDRF